MLKEDSSGDSNNVETDFDTNKPHGNKLNIGGDGVSNQNGDGYTNVKRPNDAPNVVFQENDSKDHYPKEQMDYSQDQMNIVQGSGKMNIENKVQNHSITVDTLTEVDTHFDFHNEVSNNFKVGNIPNNGKNMVEDASLLISDQLPHSNMLLSAALQDKAKVKDSFEEIFDSNDVDGNKGQSDEKHKRERINPKIILSQKFEPNTNFENEKKTETHTHYDDTGFFDDEIEEIEDDYEEDDEDFYDEEEEEDDDDDWTYYDRKYVEEEEDFLEELLDARGAEERIVNTKESKPAVREAKVASHGEDQDKGDLEETEKSHYDGPIENKPSPERLEIVQKVQELIVESGRTEREKEKLAAKDPPGGPLRGETMKMEEAENKQAEDAMRKEHEKEEIEESTTSEAQAVSIKTEETGTLQDDKSTDNTQQLNSENEVETIIDHSEKVEDIKEDNAESHQVKTEDDKEEVELEDHNRIEDEVLETGENLPVTEQEEKSSVHHEDLPAPSAEEAEKEPFTDIRHEGTKEDTNQDSTTLYDDTASGKSLEEEHGFLASLSLTACPSD